MFEPKYIAILIGPVICNTRRVTTAWNIELTLGVPVSGPSALHRRSHLGMRPETFFGDHSSIKGLVG